MLKETQIFNVIKLGVGIRHLHFRAVQYEYPCSEEVILDPIVSSNFDIFYVHLIQKIVSNIVHTRVIPLESSNPSTIKVPCHDPRLISAGRLDTLE